MPCAMPRQRRARDDSVTTSALGGATGCIGATGATGGGVDSSGRRSAALGAIADTAPRILPHTSSGGSTDATIACSSPRRRSQDSTSALKSSSTFIIVSTCVRSSPSSVPRTYSAASAIWSSFSIILSCYVSAILSLISLSMILSENRHPLFRIMLYVSPRQSRISSMLRRNQVFTVLTGVLNFSASCSRLQPL